MPVGGRNQRIFVLWVPSAPAFHTHALSVHVDNLRKNIINGLKLIEAGESGTGDRIGRFRKVRGNLGNCTDSRKFRYEDGF